MVFKSSPSVVDVLKRITLLIQIMRMFTLFVFLLLPILVFGIRSEQSILMYSIVSNFYITVVPNRCYQPIRVGPCRAAFPRFAYSRSRRRCVAFTYGGCSGNRNRFNTMMECRLNCERGRQSKVKQKIIIYI